MKIALLTLIITLASFALNWLFPGLPWYTTFILAFLAGVYSGRMKTKAFAVGFFGVLLFWGILLLMSHLRSDGLISLRIGALFTEQMGTYVAPAFLIFLNLLVGSLIGGLAALSGKLIALPSEGHNRYGRHNQRNKGSYKLKLN